MNNIAAVWLFSMMIKQPKRIDGKIAKLKSENF